jgi:hypothetical protein
MVALAAATSPPHARATHLVYEGFSYGLSQSVIGANGGSGWGTNRAWEITSGTNTNAVNFLSNSMTYRDTTAAANALVVSGGRVATALSDVGIWRDLASVVSDKTVFVSFLIKSSNTASANSYGGLSLYDSTNEVFFVGELYTPINQIGVSLPRQNAAAAFPSLSPTNTNFLVAKIEPSSRRMIFYLNPTNLAEEERNNMLIFSDILPFDFSRIRIQSGGGGQSTEIDEIRIGTNWSAVVPIDGDPDSDGLLTSAELDIGTDPLKIDTNGDGFTDSEAVFLANSLAVSPLINFSSVNTLMQRIATDSPSRFGLYTKDSIMDLRLGGTIVARQGDTATFVMETQATTNLKTQVFSTIGQPLTNVILMPGDAGFLRIQARP